MDPKKNENGDALAKESIQSQPVEIALPTSHFRPSINKLISTNGNLCGTTLYSLNCMRLILILNYQHFYHHYNGIVLVLRCRKRHPR